MKKVIDLAEIELREKELINELAKLRALKRYATKFGADYAGVAENGEVSPQNELPAADIPVTLRTIIGSFTDEFNYQDIEKSLTNNSIKISRSSIFEFLAKLKLGDEIATVRPGAGRRPAQFKLTDKFMPF